MGLALYSDECVVEGFSRRHARSKARTRVLLDELTRFLTVAALTREPLSPTEELDQLWHHLLADEGTYSSYCDAHLPAPVLHVPSPARAERTRRARELIAKYFGAADDTVWSSSLGAAPADCQTHVNDPERSAGNRS